MEILFLLEHRIVLWDFEQRQQEGSQANSLELRICVSRHHIDLRASQHDHLLGEHPAKVDQAVRNIQKTLTTELQIERVLLYQNDA